MLSRRCFLASATVATWMIDPSEAQTHSGESKAESNRSGQVKQTAHRPLVIASSNGIRTLEKAMAILRAGGNTLDAVVEGVALIEDDPEDEGVGVGGLPNADGEVELDASVMYGPTGTAGAVGALKHIRNPSRVARLVMERTNRVFLVGEGALRFALAHGFQKENLLTEKSRLAWLKWKEELSSTDDWIATPKSKEKQVERKQGTISCLAVDSAGDISGVTTTSGLAFKLPGRVGDSPIIGAGLYVDNQVGAAGATGNGEANIRIVGAHTVVELMRQGRNPEQACLETLERVVNLYKDNAPNLSFYALNKKGESASATVYKGAKYCLHDGLTAYQLDSAWLLEKKPQ